MFQDCGIQLEMQKSWREYVNHTTSLHTSKVILRFQRAKIEKVLKEITMIV